MSLRAHLVLAQELLALPVKHRRRALAGLQIAGERALEHGRQRLLARRTSESDSRRMELRVTAAGREVFRKIVPLLAERERRMLRALSEPERRQFNVLLMKIAQKVPDWAVPDLSSLAPATRGRRRRSPGR